MKQKQIVIICGHYGVGKTNFSIQKALDHQEQGENVTLIDLDIINPYFRSSEYGTLLGQKGIDLITPVMANTTLDAPALPPSIYGALGKETGTVILDVGGDDAGAAALGRFRPILEEKGYVLLYVVNRYRKRIQTPEEAIENLREIETVSGLQATGIVNNSHLSHLTGEDEILEGVSYGEQIAALLQLPYCHTVLSKLLFEKMKNQVPNPYPVEIHVLPPWAEESN